MSRPVLLLDDDDDLLESMAEVVQQLGGRNVVKARSLEELKQMAPLALTSEVAIMDINLGPRAPSGMDAFRWLLEQEFGGRVVFLTGHAASFPLVEEASRMRGVLVLAKPIACERLLGLLEPSS